MCTTGFLTRCIPLFFGCEYWQVMEEIVRAFVEAPSEKFLDQCSRNQLVKMAEFYSFDVGDRQ